MRYYANANRHPWTRAHDRTPVVAAPVGLTLVTYENPPGIHSAEERVRAFKAGPQAGWFNHVNVTAHEHGGHFRTPTSGWATCAAPSTAADLDVFWLARNFGETKVSC
ncbi:hypothetical protein SAMN04489732_102221 [Amycolatopsis saalfeldensis]|uniref:Uncharacterized protein n=2 Tax=Amycolatopsis saalfeldensis TaxID=394193 RepID=A0A1H8SPK2_9PSEU|nr:hypothetical protein SAMN04489732_102221 [Amycolatopsis saalfeldensis]